MRTCSYLILTLSKYKSTIDIKIALFLQGFFIFTKIPDIYTKTNNMPQIIDGLKDPYGLKGGTILSGSVSSSCDAFWYYAVTGTTAIIKFSNLAGGSVSASFAQGQSIYGNITSVTQSTGVAIVYSGSYMPSY